LAQQLRNLQGASFEADSCQAVELLSNVIYLKDAKLLQTFWAYTPTRHRLRGLEKLVGVSSHRNIFPSDQVSHEEIENLRRLELLLDAGARWNPDLKDLRYVRRNLLDTTTGIWSASAPPALTPGCGQPRHLARTLPLPTLMARIGTVDARWSGNFRCCANPAAQSVVAMHHQYGKGSGAWLIQPAADFRRLGFLGLNRAPFSGSG